MGRPHRWTAVGGLVGPCGFVAAWIVSGRRDPTYSPVHEAISRLAAVHAPARLVMTGGFLTFGVGVGVFAIALRASLPGWAWATVAAASASTLAVAALPLDTGVDGLHAASAVVGYATLAATPLLAAPPLAARRAHRAARASRLAGSGSALLLAASLVGPWHGLLQRAGLGVSDLWICAVAVALLGRGLPAGPAGVGPQATGSHDAGRGTNG